MRVQFPSDPAEKRQALLRAVGDIKEVLAAHADESEALRTLHPASVSALTDSGLMGLKCPVVLGGAEADPLTQMEVIESVSYIDPSAGWCLSICNGGQSVVGACLPQSAVERAFAGDRLPCFAGSFTARPAVAVSGGYRLSGHWPWASGIRHADWLGATVIVSDNGDAPYPRFALFPVDQAEVYDNWHVSGLTGTGSSDFSLSDIFVPEDFTIDMRRWEPLRGGPFYRLGLPGMLVNELAGFALGVARRALDTIVNLAKTKQRGYGRQTNLADRAAFQRAIGESDLRLRAIRALAFETLEKAWDIVRSGQSPSTDLQIDLRSMATLVVDVARDIASIACRYGGGTAIQLNCILQRCLRDLEAESAHLFVSDISYELHGQCLLGREGIDPMA